MLLHKEAASVLGWDLGTLRGMSVSCFADKRGVSPQGPEGNHSPRMPPVITASQQSDSCIVAPILNRADLYNPKDAAEMTVWDIWGHRRHCSTHFAFSRITHSERRHQILRTFSVALRRSLHVARNRGLPSTATSVSHGASRHSRPRKASGWLQPQTTPWLQPLKHPEPEPPS